MVKLYYGNGECSIEGSEIRGVEIRYKESKRIRIEKTANDNFHIAANNKKIIIFPLGIGYLSDLFTYKGEFIIISVIVADNEGKNVPTTVKRVMNYSELMDTKAEDLTVKSESLNAGHRYASRVKKTIVRDNIIKNQYSSGELYTKDGVQSLLRSPASPWQKLLSTIIVLS